MLFYTSSLDCCLVPQGDYTDWAVFENRDHKQRSLDLREENSKNVEKVE
jgi:hypothetical protein